MNEERITELLVRLHQGLARLGPGNSASTLRALALCEHLPPAPDVLDVGCGTGAQTLDLAKATDGQIKAVDLFDVFLQQLNESAGEQHLDHRIQTEVADMSALPFAPASFDLVWSEGAAYNIGFDQALTTWKPLLRPGGYLALTELSWFQPSPPDELTKFWSENYPAIRNVEANLDAAKALGLQLVDNFHLPTEAWTHGYYAPLKKRLALFQTELAEDADAQELVRMMEYEMSLMDRFSEFFGYEFFVLRSR